MSGFFVAIFESIHPMTKVTGVLDIYYKNTKKFCHITSRLFAENTLESLAGSYIITIAKLVSLINRESIGNKRRIQL